MRRFMKNGIGQKISFSFSLLIFFVIIVLLAVAYLLNRNSVNAINSNYAMILLNQKNERLTAMVNETDVFSKALISNRDIQQALQGGDRQTGVSLSAIYSEMIAIPTKFVAGVVIFGENENMYREIEGDVGISVSANLEQIREAIGQSDGELVYVGSSYTEFGSNYGEAYLYIARKIRDLTSFRDLGFVVMAVRESAFWSSFEMAAQIGSYYITDGEGLIVSAADKTLLSQDIGSVLGIKPLQNGGTVMEQGFVVNQCDSPGIGLRIVNKIPVSLLYHNYYDILRAIVLVGSLSLILSVYISIGIASHITKPLQKLSANMREVAGGNRSSRIALPENTAEEIVELNRVFVQMLQELEGVMQRIQQESIKEKDAELRALRAQINPHFLYNTLDTVYWMVMEKGEYDIAELITRIGDLLRYAIRKGSQKALLQDEMAQIENYLLIQKARYEEKLSYEITIAPDAMQLYVLSFTLQPLVENAISHGLMSQKGQGTVWIRAFLEQDDLIVEIKDDGTGMPEEISTTLLAQDQPGPDTGHIGLRNVDQRIKQVLGEGYGVEIYSRENEGTTMTIRFPRMREQEDGARADTVG